MYAKTPRLLRMNTERTRDDDISFPDNGKMEDKRRTHEKRKNKKMWTQGVHAHQHTPSICPAIRVEGREIRTPNLLIWSQTRCRCAIPPRANTCVSMIIHFTRQSGVIMT